MELPGAEAAEVRAQPQQTGQVARLQRGRIGRNHAEYRLHGARHLVHEPPELVVGLRVARRVARQLAAVLVVVVPLREVVAVRQRRERALQRQDVQAVPRQVEIANDLGAQQAHHVREHRELEAGKDLLGHGRAADALAPLEHEHALAGAGEIRGAHEPVVAAADDDCVVGRRHDPSLRAILLALLERRVRGASAHL